MRCPGQDTRYWTGELAFEVACPKCAHQVEFFKDEGSTRCSNCRHMFPNPRMSFDCAQWCAYAEKCLGSKCDRKAPVNAGEGLFASRLIRALKAEYAHVGPRVVRALLAFQYARELLAEEGGDPRTTLAAAVLIETGGDVIETDVSADTDVPETGDIAAARRIPEEIGFEDDMIACVCRILQAHGTGRELDTIEFKVVSDAYALSRRKHIGSGED